MIKFLFFILLSFPVFSAVKVEMDFSSPELKQGELAHTRLQIQGAEDLNLQQLKGQTIGKTVYFYDVSPLLKREGSSLYEAEARVIFVKVPESHEVQDKLGSVDVVLNWGGLKVKPTPSAPSFVFGTFEVPEKMRWVLWTLLSLSLAGILAFLAWFFSGKVRKKRAERKRLGELKSSLLGCKHYEDVVIVWKNKQTYFNAFPHIKEPFHKMELVLNRYQFKPRQTETEKIEIMEAYRKFSRTVEGGLNGV